MRKKLTPNSSHDWFYGDLLNIFVTSLGNFKMLIKEKLLDLYRDTRISGCVLVAF